MATEPVDIDPLDAAQLALAAGDRKAASGAVEAFMDVNFARPWGWSRLSVQEKISFALQEAATERLRQDKIERGVLGTYRGADPDTGILTARQIRLRKAREVYDAEGFAGVRPAASAGMFHRIHVAAMPGARFGSGDGFAVDGAYVPLDPRVSLSPGPPGYRLPDQSSSGGSGSMTETVASLRDLASRASVQFVEGSLAEASIVAGAELRFGGEAFVLDEVGLGVLSDAVGGPGGKYLAELPSQLRQEVLEWHLQETKGGKAVVEAEGLSLVGLWPGDRVIPRADAVAAIERAVGPDAEVRDYSLSGGAVKAYILTNELQVEPKVGEPTHGGIAFHSHVSPAKGKHQQTWVSTYLERLICANGMLCKEEEGLVTLRGRTVEQVIEELEEAAQRILTDVVPRRLEQWEKLVHHEVKPADVSKLVEAYCEENGVGGKVMARALGASRSLEPPVSEYDIVNVITEIQNLEGVRDQTREKLMSLGGRVIAETEHHRCGQCRQKVI